MRSKRRAFTMIELLVVVAIIALLISILLPSLRDAREQSKVAKCLTNLRQVNTVAVAYFLDFNDNFPFTVTQAGGYLGLCTWSYGGKSPDEYWKTSTSGLFHVPVTVKPFNPYLMSGRVEPDLRDSGGKLIQRTEIPPAACPGDRFSHQRTWQDEAEPLSCYNDVGISYQYNLHGLSDINVDLWGPNSTGQNWVIYGRYLVRDVLGKYSATYVMFLEDPVDYGLPDPPHDGIQLPGNHFKFGKHSVGFLDGHAEYKSVNTKRWCGLGWSTLNQKWTWRGLPRPPTYYTAPRKNCDPQ